MEEALPRCSGSVLSSFNGFVNVNKGQFLALKNRDVFYTLELFLDKLYVFSFLVESSLPVTSQKHQSRPYAFYLLPHF